MNKKILINYNDYAYNVVRQSENQPGGVGYYRMVKPAETLQAAGLDVTLWGSEIMQAGKSLEERWERVFTDFDVYWTSYFADDHAAAAIFYMRDKHKKQVWIDIDDNYLDILDSNPIYDQFGPGKQKRAFMSAVLSLADVITCSTEPLKKRLEDHFLTAYSMHKTVVVIPNMNDVNDWDFKAKKPNKRKTIIGYSGSNSHQEDLMMVMPSIREVMERNPSVWFHCLGAMDTKYIPTYFKDFSDKLLKRCVLVPSTQTFRQYPAWLAKQGWDIGIAPLVDSPFTVSKSHIKFMEYAMYKIPTVASRVYPYHMELAGREVITDGETGFLCRPRDWAATLERLVRDPAERERVGKNAYDHVRKNWQYEDSEIPDTVRKLLA